MSDSEPLRSGVRRPGVRAWLRLARVYRAINQRAADYARGFGLSLAQFDVLAQVGASPGRTQQELADALVVTKGNVCQLLNRMEEDGLIRREPAGRTNRLFLTPRGEELFGAMVPGEEDVIDAQFAGLDPREQRELLDGLRKLDRALS